MAYKFQLGPAVMSGSLEQEGSIDITESGVLKIAGSTLADASRNITAAQVSGSSHLLAGGNLTVAGTVTLAGSADATMVASDGMYFRDADDGLMKREAASDVRDLFFSAVSGDVQIAAGGAATIQANAVEGSMLNSNVVADTLQYSGSALRLSASVAGAGIGFSSGVLSLDIDELDALGGAGLHQTEDHFVFSDNGTEKKITFSNLQDAVFADVSGDIQIDAGGAATIQADSVEGTMLNTNAADGSTMELSSDSLSVLKVPNAISVDDATLQLNTGTTYDGAAARTISIKDGGVDADALATSVAGDGLTGGGGSALAVQVSGALKISGDKVGISGSFAGIGLAYDGGVNSISGIDLDLNSLTDAAVADGDSFAFIDADDSSTTKKVHVADVATLFAGAGLTAASSVMAVANASNGGIDVQADAIAMDINDLEAVGVDVAADFMAFSDEGTAGVPTKKISIANLMTAIAGSGIDATNGVLSVGGSQVSGSGDHNVAALLEGFNFQSAASLTANRTWTLPTGSGIDAGSVVRVKAGNVNGNKIIVSRAGSDTIDGVATSVELEANSAAVSLMYVGNGSWQLF